MVFRPIRNLGQRVLSTERTRSAVAKSKRVARTRPPRSTAVISRIIRTLQRQHLDTDTELNFKNAYGLLVATTLSAQCTDERVNAVTPNLLARYPDPASLARASTVDLEHQIKSTGFFRSKACSLIGMANAVTESHAGQVPARMEDLVRLPGVGRKTANVLLGHALGVHGFPVDRHVLRVANCFGITQDDDPELVEPQLCASMPPDNWTRVSDTLILHGRRVCKSKPLCDRCLALGDCPGRQEVNRSTPRQRKTTTTPSPQ